MEDWKEYKLREVTTVLGDGIHGTPKYDENGTVYFINGNNLEDGKIIIRDTTKKVSLEEAEKHKKPLTDRTLFVSINGTIGNVARYHGEKCILGKSACYFNVREDFDLNYIYYVIANKSFVKDLERLATGTTIKNVSLETMRNYTFIAPSKDEQTRIASILKSLDDKIECNRKINENLEQQAQALFKSWFVDFEPFKDQPFVESDLGMIPEGWKVVGLSDLADVSKVSVNPQKQPQKMFKHYSIPSYDDGMNPEEQYGNEIKSNKFVVGNKMTLFSKLNPRIKRVWYVENVANNSICSTEFVPYKAKKDSQSSFLYGLINSKGFYDYIMSMVNGATGSHQRFHPEESLDFKIAFSDDYCKKYCEVVTPILNNIIDIRTESRRLAELRDTLLPKLMSGEINVNNF